MDSLTFQLPSPPLILRPNGRAVEFLKRKARREARLAAAEEARRVLSDNQMEPPRWGKASMGVVLFLGPRNKQPDPDNLIASLKPYIDGLADAGIVANDKNLWPDRPEIRRVERLPRVEITITKL